MFKAETDWAHRLCALATLMEPGVYHPRRISAALFLAGFTTFSLLYCTQPLLPEFAVTFAVGPAESSLAISVTTACLAVSILATGALSEVIGRRGLMFWSMALAAVLNILAALAPSWEWLLMARAAEGLALGGVPAVAMAYLAEEMPPRRLGLAMGLYVGGTAFGGMVGRVAMGPLSELLSWRGALVAVGLMGLIVALVFIALLPRSRHFVAMRHFSMDAHLAAWRRHLCNPALFGLFIIGFLSLGGFMTVYNYLAFLLSAPPYGLSSAQIGLVFLAYIGGVVASWIAGGLADHFGRGRLMLVSTVVFLVGLLLTLGTALPLIITGVAIITIGFFIVHSTASGWVGWLAVQDRGHASSLYLLSYYAGASVLGSAGGWIWHIGGWVGVVTYCTVLLAMVFAIACKLQILGSAPRAITGHPQLKEYP